MEFILRSIKNIVVVFWLMLICFKIGLAQSNKTKTLNVGDSIPQITFLSLENKEVDLKTDYKGKPLVIIFYRANWCPFCNAHLSDLQSYFRPLMKLGYTLVAISTESVENLKKTKDNNYLKYELLSDNTMGGISAYGIVNGNVAVPSVFITDSKGVIKYLYTNVDYKTRLSGEAVFFEAKKALND